MSEDGKRQDNPARAETLPAKAKSAKMGNVPAKTENALDREVSIKAHIDESGLTVGGKSRALAALDQLVGGLVGIPGGIAEGYRRRAELRRAILEQQLENDLAILRENTGLSPFGTLTQERVLREEYRRQENRMLVWQAAEEHLALPSPDQEKPTPDQDESKDQIDPDWLNRFGSFAQDVSNEDLQRVWGRLLAGEINKPHTISISTLRILAELDSDVATMFQSLYARTVNGYALRKDRQDGGESYEDLAAMEDAGLIQTSAFLSVEIRPETDGFGYVVGKTHLMRVAFAEESNKLISFPAVVLSRAGKQLGSILENDELRAFREIGPTLKPVDKVEICKIKARYGDQLFWDVLETLPSNH
ncbi:MAG TPA: DUF2806 domain-containing protein [Caulobacteraceae bacterium]|jgi:hypothetical protein|nr:DUF2806 domain-containing protein [Caulobacteraceae bacterium]